jgi:hypothetical protein
MVQLAPLRGDDYHPHKPKSSTQHPLGQLLLCIVKRQ